MPRLPIIAAFLLTLPGTWCAAEFAPLSPNVLIASDVEADELLAVDIDTGDVLVLGEFPSEFGFVESLAFDPSTQTLFGVDANGANSSELLAIDLPTASVMSIGLTGVQSIDGLVFDTLAGTLLGVSDTVGLFEINTATGAASLIGGFDADPTDDITFEDVESLAFDPVSGRLFATNSVSGVDDLVEINRQTGIATLIGPTTGPDGDFVGLSSLTFDPASGQLLSIDFISEELAQIDPVTGETVFLDAVDSLDVLGLTLVPTSLVLPVPEPASATLLALVGLLPTPRRRGKRS